MVALSPRGIGQRLAAAFRLETRPLVVYGSETLPPGAVPLSDVNRCFAVSLYQMATGHDVPAIYVSAETTEGCCAGGLSHVGYIPVPEETRYFVSTGKEDVRGGVAEYLKASPELVDLCTTRAGPVHPPGKYLIVQACETLPDPSPAVRSFCIFGTGEQVRNMAALVHFDRDDPFSPVIVPWGSACSTYITYPPVLPTTLHAIPRSWAPRTQPRTTHSRRT